MAAASLAASASFTGLSCGSFFFDSMAASTAFICASQPMRQPAGSNEQGHGFFVAGLMPAHFTS